VLCGLRRLLPRRPHERAGALSSTRVASGCDRSAPQEHRSQFALWALMAAPLILGADIRGTMRANAVTPAMRAVLLNPDIIAIDQVACSTAALHSHLTLRCPCRAQDELSLPPRALPVHADTPDVRVYARDLAGNRTAGKWGVMRGKGGDTGES
jgi:hypothetical protein